MPYNHGRVAPVYTMNANETRTTVTLYTARSIVRASGDPAFAGHWWRRREVRCTLYSQVRRRDRVGLLPVVRRSSCWTASGVWCPWWWLRRRNGRSSLPTANGEGRVVCGGNTAPSVRCACTGSAPGTRPSKYGPEWTRTALEWRRRRQQRRRPSPTRMPPSSTVTFVLSETIFTATDPATRTSRPVDRLLRRRRHRQRLRQLQTRRPAARQSRTRISTTRTGLTVQGCTWPWSN